MSRFFPLLLGIGLMLTALPCAAETIAVVVNSANPNSAVTRETLIDIYKGRKTQWANNAKIVPVNFKLESNYRQAFYSEVLGARSAAEQFFVPGSPNAFKTSSRGSSRSILRFVARFEGGIGYLPAKDTDESVKVVYTFEPDD